MPTTATGGGRYITHDAKPAAPPPSFARIPLPLVALWMAMACTTVTAADVRVIRIDGTGVTATWVAASNGTAVHLQTADGPLVIPLHDLRHVVFGAHRARRGANPQGAFPEAHESDAKPDDSTPPTAAPALFHLADGGHLPGALLTGPSTPEAVRARTVLGDAIALPLDRLAGIQLADVELFPRCGELYRAALENRRPGQDVLITRSTDDVKTLRGRLDRLDAAGGTFVFGNRSRTFKTRKIFGVVLAKGTTGESREPFPVTVTLRSGSVFSGRIEGSDTVAIRLATSIGVFVEVALSEIARLDIRSDRVVYLSDLEPTSQSNEGLVHRPWPIRMDRSAGGGPISIAGRTFPKGVGVHSKSEVAWRLDGDFEKFATTIGIDDAVRPRGDVVFRVLGDGKPLFDSGPITGEDAPRDVLVNIAGVQTLTLVVDYGDELDVADHADWADARLLKPTPAMKKTP